MKCYFCFCVQSDVSSDSGCGHNNLTDEQKLAEKKPLSSILKPPSAPRPPRRDDTVIEMELAALAASNLSTSSLHHETKKEEGLPELPMHLRPSPSPPPSPSPSPPRACSSPKPLQETIKEYDECGTLAFMAAGFDDEEGEAEKLQSHVAREVDVMNCSVLVAMAVSNSVVEKDTTLESPNSIEKEKQSPRLASIAADVESQSTTKPSPPSPIQKKMVDRSTSPSLPGHLLPLESTNSNANNNNANAELQSSVVDNGEASPRNHRAHLLTQYHHILQNKMLKRNGSPMSVGNSGSRLSLTSSLPLIPESLPATCTVTDKTSNEFPSAQTAGGAGGEEIIKKVSFQDLSPNYVPGELRLVGRPLPARPLPPIGADPNSLNDGYALASPRSNSRPLPPLAGMGTGNSISYDTVSLHSTGSSTHILHKSGSTNSLPNPDPRYSTSSHLQKLGGIRRKTPPPATTPPGYRLPRTSFSLGISNIGGRLSPHQPY